MSTATTKNKKSTAGASAKKTSNAKAAPASKSKTASSAASSKSKSKEQEPMLKELFIDMMKDIYWAEKHLTKALPKMKKAATSEELQEAFDTHLQQTEEHIARLEQAFDQLGEKAQAKKCDAMDGLTKEAESNIEETEDGSLTRDVALIVSAQKVEHYEIAAYGSLVTLANTMNLGEVASIFEQTLQEEKDTDALLTGIAENNINQQAQDQEGEEVEEEDEEESDDTDVEDDEEEA
jgi:ferritin-like metal-binding protein YciE